MWENIRMVLNNTKNSAPSPLHFFVDDKIESDGLKIANEFNKYFTNIGTDLASKIPNTDENDFRRHPLRVHCESSFSFNYTTSDDVSKLISKLKTKNNAGHDRMSTKLLQKMRFPLSPALSLIINQSLFTGIFPDSLKIAKILPIFKKGDPSYFWNYRPLSLLPAISKVFEKVVFIQIYEYFNSNNLLYKSQYGFRTNHSTELIGIEFLDKILHCLDDQHTPISIFLDLSKVFDTLDHDILLFKLKHYGITGTPYKWFCSYLSNRQQYIQYETYKSEKLKITTGVPQGSVLWPLLFIIYMNDIYTASDSFKAILHADDTTFTTAVGSLARMVAGLQEISRDISFELSTVKSLI